MGMTSVCKGCGASILWIRTRAGSKAMPCDAEPVPYWGKPGGPMKIVTPEGDVISAELGGDPDDVTGMGYVSHFATCPAAELFRRRKA